ncbi:MAG: hypothetical protein LBJ91_05205, partial [Clostridiales Family XIII bacterium]|nr:hypothetical protein [Clostridiales Family XIII bacterium]
TVAAFISQYYVNQSSPPKEILTDGRIPDEQFIADALSESCGYKIRIHAPLRGAKKALLRLAKNDVDEAVRREEQRAKAEEKRRERLSAQFEEAFGEPLARQRIEAYDISHTGGADSVGAMVVFEGGEPERAGYRKFKIRGDAKGDDYAAMQEVLYRRLKRAIAGDKSFLPLPGLFLIDGGKGHVASVRRVLEALSVSAAAKSGDSEDARSAARAIRDILVAGMVKDDKHRTRALIIPKAGGEPGRKSEGPEDTDGDTPGGEDEYAEIALKGKPELFHLVGRVQEEVHRFAVEYHHKRRTKGMTE